MFLVAEGVDARVGRIARDLLHAEVSIRDARDLGEVRDRHDLRTRGEAAQRFRDAVRGLQEEFRFRDQSGNPGRGLAVDGIFGPKTATAVRSFQQALGITVDGIVGPLTWRALVSGMLSF